MVKKNRSKSSRKSSDERQKAAAIEQPTYLSEFLYYDYRYNGLYCVCGHVDEGILTICEDDWSDTIPLDELRTLDNIRADEVQERLGAHDYPQMLEAMKTRFNAPTAFDDIKAWLYSEHLNYYEMRG